MHWLRAFEIFLLAAGGVSAFALIRTAPAARHQLTRLTLALVLGFLAVYAAKTALLPLVRYSGSGWLKAVYLAFLAAHASLIPAALVCGMVSVVHLLRTRHAAAETWMTRTARLWVGAAASGLVSFLLLETAGS